MGVTEYFFSVPIFDVTVHVWVASNPCLFRNNEAVTKIFRGPNEDGDGWDAICLDPVDDHFGLIFDSEKLTNNLFAHELYHLTNAILRLHSIDDEETGALLHGYLFEEIGAEVFRK